MQAVVTLALLLLASTPSLQPFFAPGDQTLDPRIEGAWRLDDDMWQIARTPQCSDYTLTINQGLGGTYTATLFRIGTARYLDLKPQAPAGAHDEFLALHYVPAHTLLRIEPTSDSLRIAPLDSAKLGILLAQQPNLVAHVALDRGDGKPLLVLTAPTAQLKALVSGYGERLFARPLALRRGASVTAPAPLPTTPPPGPLAPSTGGKTLNSAQAALRAARVANDLAEKQFGARPFNPTNWTARFEDNQWHWGRQEQPGVGGFSADVTMNRDGSQVDAQIFFQSPEEPATAVPAVPPPPAPILPQAR